MTTILTTNTHTTTPYTVNTLTAQNTVHHQTNHQTHGPQALHPDSTGLTNDNYMTTPHTATPYKTNNNKSHKMDTSMMTQDAEATLTVHSSVHLQMYQMANDSQTLHPDDLTTTNNNYMTTLLKATLY
jgi:hypothetical protein